MVNDIANWLGSGSINVFGCPFSGKDTQAHKLAKLFGGVVIGGGDILRSHHDPAAIEKIMAAGGLIPSDFYLDLVLPYLSDRKFAGKPLILSAVGRRQGEETIIMRAAKTSGHPLKAVILLQLSEHDVWKRFEAAKTIHDRGERADDARTVIKNRLLKFKEKTMPVIEFYRNNGLLIEVDGSKTRDEVTDEILAGLRRLY